MSAYMVGATHIDAMLTAGLHRFSSWAPWHLAWLWPEPTLDELRQARVPGTAISVGDVMLADERRRHLTYDTAGRVGAMLLAENRRSVDFRYAEDEIEQPYVFTELGNVINPVTVLKAINGYEYQACEHPEWRFSEAYQFCDALRRRMTQYLPGYEDAEAWHITDPTIFGPVRSKPKGAS